MKNKIAFLFCLLLLATASFAAFGEDHFNFGRQWASGLNASSVSGKGLSHLAIWLGDNESYNTYWEGEMVRVCRETNLTPVIYAYVIAEYDKDQGFSDCDVGFPNHCTNGAQTIRTSWTNILSRYRSYAQGIANDFKKNGTVGTTVWLIEPDFFQYSVSGDAREGRFEQVGGGIPDDSLTGYYFNSIVSTIKSALPNAKIAVDISPWLNDDIKTWYSHFDKSKVDYLFTSGGRTQGNQSRIRNDNNNMLTWAGASAAMGGKKIIADDGYGVGGSSNDDYKEWLSVDTLGMRIQDGVIGLTIQDPDQSYYNFTSTHAISISSSSQEDLKLAVELKSGNANQTVTAGDSIGSIVYKCENFTSIKPSGFPRGVNGSYNESTKTYTISGTVNESLMDSTYNYKLVITGVDSTKEEVSGKITVKHKPVTTTLQLVSGSLNQEVYPGDDIVPVVIKYANIKSLSVARSINLNYAPDQNNSLVTISGTVSSSLSEGKYFVALLATGVDNDATDTLWVTVKHKAVAPTFTLTTNNANQTVTAGNAVEPIVYQYANIKRVVAAGLPQGLNVAKDENAKTYTISGTVADSLTDYEYDYTLSVEGVDSDTVVSGKITVKHKPVTTTVSLVSGKTEQTVTAGEKIETLVFQCANIDSVMTLGLPEGISSELDNVKRTVTISGTLSAALLDKEYEITVNAYGPDNNASASAKIVVKHKPVVPVFTLISNNASQTVTAGNEIRPIVYEYANVVSAEVSGIPRGLKLVKGDTSMTYAIVGEVADSLTDYEYDYTITVRGSDTSLVVTGKITVKHKPVTTTVTLAGGSAEQTVTAGNKIESLVFKYEHADSIATYGFPKGLSAVVDKEKQMVTVSGEVDSALSDSTYTVTVDVAGPDNNASATANVVVKHRPVTTTVTLTEGSADQTVTAGDKIETLVFSYSNAKSVKVEGVPAGISSDIDETKEIVVISGTVADSLQDKEYIVTVNVTGVDNDASVSVKIIVSHKPVVPVFTLISDNAAQTVTAGDTIQPIVYRYENITAAKATNLPKGIQADFDEKAKTYTLSGRIAESLSDSTWTYTISVTGIDSDTEVTGKIVVKHKPTMTTIELVEGPAEQTVMAGSEVVPIVFKYANMTSASVEGLPSGEINIYKDKTNKTLTIRGAVDENLRDSEYTVKVYVYGADNDDSASIKIVVKHKSKETRFVLASGDSVQTVVAGDTIEPIVYRYENLESAEVSGLPSGLDAVLDENAKVFKIFGRIDVDAAAQEYVFTVDVTGIDNNTSTTGRITVTQSSSSEEPESSSSEEPASSSSEIEVSSSSETSSSSEAESSSSEVSSSSEAESSSSETSSSSEAESSSSSEAESSSSETSSSSEAVQVVVTGEIQQSPVVGGEIEPITFENVDSYTRNWGMYYLNFSDIIDGKFTVTGTVPEHVQPGTYTENVTIRGTVYSIVLNVSEPEISSSSQSSSSAAESSSSAEESSSSVEESSSSADESSSSEGTTRVFAAANAFKFGFADNKLTVALSKSSAVRVQVFDMMGNLIANYSDHVAGSGTFDLGQLPQGSYLVRIASSGAVRSARIVVK